MQCPTGQGPIYLSHHCCFSGSTFSRQLLWGARARYSDTGRGHLCCPSFTLNCVQSLWKIQEGFARNPFAITNLMYLVSIWDVLWNVVDRDFNDKKAKFLALWGLHSSGEGRQETTSSVSYQVGQPVPRAMEA